MNQTPDAARFPDPADLRRATEIYLDQAYGPQRPEHVEAMILPPGGSSEEFLTGEAVEPEPRQAPPQEVRWYSLRLGNPLYPNMKLRIARAPAGEGWIYSVDAHDEMLIAPPGSPDAGPLEELKQHNARLAGAIEAAWQREGLLTEKTYLRRRIDRTRAQTDGTDPA